MRNLSGTWRFTQRWEGAPAYSFNAEFLENGTISINNGQFFGTYAILGNSSYLSLAIADFNGKTITSYVGNYVGLRMGGEAIGASANHGKSHSGIWTAQLLPVEEKKGFHVPA